MKTPSAAFIALLLTTSAAPVWAHHTISAVYDTYKLLTIRGVVTEVDWQNPHVLIHLDVKNDDGTTVSWNVETRSVNILKRCGLDQDFVRVGETVSMDVAVAKDGTRRAALEAIALPGGTAYLSMSKTSC